MTRNPTPTAAPKPGNSRSRRGLRIALVVSLMINVLLVGVMAGGMMRFARIEPPLLVQPDMRSLWRALPGEARSDLQRLTRDGGLAGDRPSREERRSRIEAVNARILEMLRADEFDRAGFAALLGSERDALQRRLNAAHQAFADRVASLSVQERQEMAESLAESWARHPAR